MARFLEPIMQALDTAGISIPGAKLYFYEKGTTTPQDTFTDDTLTTANTNPVIANGSGRFGDIFLLSAQYTVQFDDENDVNIWTSNVDGAESSLIQDVIDSAGVTGGTDALSQAIARYAAVGGIFYVDNGSADDYELSATGTGPFVVPDVLIDGLQIYFRPATTSLTTTPTIELTEATGGAKIAKANDGTALAIGDIVAGQVIGFSYDLSNDDWRILGAAGGVKNAVSGDGVTVDNTDPSNPIFNTSDLVVKGTRTISGSWAIAGLTANKPCYLVGGATSGSPFTQYKVTAGTSGNGESGGAGSWFAISTSSTAGNVTLSGTVIIPNATSLTIETVFDAATMTLELFQ